MKTVYKLNIGNTNIVFTTKQKMLNYLEGLNEYTTAYIAEDLNYISLKNNLTGESEGITYTNFELI